MNLLYTTPTQNQEWRLDLNPTFGIQKTLETQGLFRIDGKTVYNWNTNQLLFRGQCDLGEKDSNEKCLLLEGSIEVIPTDTSKVRVGKIPFDLSTNAILTSPANPSLVGIMPSSPFAPQEGIWLLEGSWIPNSNWSHSLGASLLEQSTDLKVPLVPFGHFRWNSVLVDVHTLLTPRFWGVSVSYQVHTKVNVYSEANNYSDFLGGTRLEIDALENVAFRVSGEYFRNSLGIQGPASKLRVKEALDRARDFDREQDYGFPAPSSMAHPPWGTMQFLSRDLGLLDIRITGRDWMPYFTSIASINDLSAMTVLGFTMVDIPWGITEDGAKFDLAWRHFGGGPGSDFGQAAASVGGDQFWIAWTF